MKKVFQSIILMAIPASLFAQNDIDVMRYSQIQYGGTARSLSMGNAFGALGGDFSTLSINPAGTAVYRTSELTFTPTLLGQNSTSSFEGSKYKNSKYTFNFNNAGFVYSYDNEDDKGWSHFNFGFGYNRLADFSGRSNYSGVTNTSITDYFMGQVRSGTYNNIGVQDNFPFEASLAVNTDNTGLIYNQNDSVETVYTSDIERARAAFGANKVSVLTDRTTSRSGGMGEIVFSFGANYAEKLFLGATLGVTSLNYSEQTTINEKDNSGNITSFNSLSYSQNLTVTGSGVNLKVGAIFKPIDWLRVGVYAHTPTVLSLTDVYKTALDVRYDSAVYSRQGNSVTSYHADSPEGNATYQIATPARVGGSLGFVVLKKAIIGIDAEYVDYTSATIKSDNDPYTQANTDVQNKYRQCLNARFGAEYRIDDVFSVRGGYALYQSPFTTTYAPKGLNTDTRVYSAGFGIRGGGYFIDFAYYLTQAGEYVQPYSLATTAVAGSSITTATNRLAITVGLKF